MFSRRLGKSPEFEFSRPCGRQFGKWNVLFCEFGQVALEVNLAIVPKYVNDRPYAAITGSA